MFFDKSRSVSVRNRVTLQDGVLESLCAVAFVRKVASNCLSLRFMPLLRLTCLIFDQANLPCRADVSCSVRQSAISWVNVATGT